MLRTTGRSAAWNSTPTPAGSDPLRQLEHETQPPQGPAVTRCQNHPCELALGGIPVICPACRARRDWLLINQSRHVFVRCRCGHQWLEPELTRADFDAMLNDPMWTNYRTAQEAHAALGYDGSFAGTYLL